MNGTKERPRLSIFRSNKFIYAQIIDDVASKTLRASDVKIAKVPRPNGRKSRQMMQRSAGIR